VRGGPFLIRIEGIRHGYDGEDVLRGLSFTIGPGEKVVLLGANGSGKTTLLRILDGLIFPAAGRYRYRGEPVTPARLKERAFARRFRREVVLLFQEPDAMIFNPTVYDEIAFGPRQFGVASPDLDARVRRWAEELGVSPLLDRRPFDLSRGEKQRVCLAALLVLEPALLLLDEPTAGLDPRSTGWLVDFLGALEATVVTTTHNLSIAGELGDRTILLSESHEAIYDGPVDALLADRERLLAANLLHTHRHRHDGLEHGHFHTHDWE